MAFIKRLSMLLDMHPAVSPLSWQKRFYIKKQLKFFFPNARGDLQTIQHLGLSRNKTGSVAVVTPYMITEPGRSTEGWVVAFGNSALKEMDGKEIQSSGRPRVSAVAF